MYLFAQQEKKPTTTTKNVPEPVAISLAKAHLETVFSDFIIFGLDSRQKPVTTTEIPCCQSENNRQILINEYLKIHNK